MASKGRMGIQEHGNGRLPALRVVSMASKGRMGIQGVSPRCFTPAGAHVSMASKGRMGIQEAMRINFTFGQVFQWPAKAGWGFRSIVGVSTKR